jgi:HTH-type transcriptional regulator/antitoxin HigA
MTLKIIKTEKEYNLALKRLKQIFDAKKGTKQGDELELLSLLIENFEKEKHAIDLPDPIEAIKFRMEQLDYQQKNLAEVIGLKSWVSEIRNRTLCAILAVGGSIQNWVMFEHDVCALIGARMM